MNLAAPGADPPYVQKNSPIRIVMAYTDERASRLHLDTEFLVEFPGKAGAGVFAAIQLTAGEFPQAALVGVLGSPCNEDLTARTFEHTGRHMDALLQVRYSALMVT